MSEGNGADRAGKPPASSGRIVLAFAPGSTDPTLTIDPDVEVGQVWAAAFLLDCVGREVRTGQLMQAAQGRAGGPVIPGTDDLAALVERMRQGRPS